MGTNGIFLRRWGLRDYQEIWSAMAAFNRMRGEQTADEIWIAEHYPVYTLGLAGREEHLLGMNHAQGLIPVVSCDRGGQVTYHGPGQTMGYVLLDLARRKIGVKFLVSVLEQAVINVLATINITAHREVGKPGVYVAGAKIAALGLRVRRGACYHGLALNVAMNLHPFLAINPCGYAGMKVTDIRSLRPDLPPNDYHPELWGERVASEIQQLMRPNR